MDQIPILLKEMDHEIQTTRKMLSRIPDDKYDWKPHEKSMPIQRLATHIAELPTWVSMVLDTTELDFAKGDYKPKNIRSTKELLSYADECYTSSRARLAQASEEELGKLWTLRNGETVYSTDPALDVIRMSYNQIVHHRAQMGVYLRLLNVPIPGSYGPSADEPSMV